MYSNSRSPRYGFVCHHMWRKIWILSRHVVVSNGVLCIWTVFLREKSTKNHILNQDNLLSGATVLSSKQLAFLIV